MNTNWPSSKPSRVLKALLKIGWKIKSQSGSHKQLERTGWPDHTFAWHDNDEIGPVAMKKIGKKTGLKPEDL
jgi:Predicted periplasmic or secreted lipoprotein